MSVRKIGKGIGVSILIGVPLVFAAAIVLFVLAFFFYLIVYGAPVL